MRQFWHGTEREPGDWGQNVQGGPTVEDGERVYSDYCPRRPNGWVQEAPEP